MARNNLTQDIGATGLQESFGRIKDDFLREWQGPEKIRRIDEMVKNSAAIGALRVAIEMPLRGVDWFFTGPNGSDDDPVVDLLNDSLKNLTHSMNDHVVDAILAPFYGWSMFTIKYQQKDGRWLWRKFKMLGHDTVQRWLFAPDGGLSGVQQWSYLWPEPIPIERMLLYRFRKTRDNPEGDSILRPAFTSWFYVKNIQQLEAIGIERNIAGLPTVRMPMGADPDEAGDDFKRADKIVRNVRNDEQGGVVIPPPRGEGDHNRWIFELVTGGGMSKVIDTNMVISRYEKRILMTSLAQFLMLGMDNVGAMATSETGVDFFTMLVNALADMIAETFSKYAVERLLELNGIDPDGYMLNHSPAGDIGLDILADFLQKAGVWLSRTPQDEQWLRSIARMPDKSIEELEELYEEKKALAEAGQQALARGGNSGNSGNNGQSGNDAADTPEDELSAAFPDLFAVSNKATQQEMAENERVFNRGIQAFLNGQRRRVTAGAKEMRAER